MKKIFLMILGFSILVISGCKKNYLTLYDTSTVSPANFPTTIAQVNQELTGAYAYTHSFGLWGHTMLGKNVYCYDHTQDMSWIGDQFWLDQTQNNTKPDNGQNSDTWRDCWKGIQQCNTLLADLDRFTTTYAQPGDTVSIRYVRGQTNYLRALFYYYAENLFGASFIHNGTGGDALGVPIVTQTPVTLQDTRVTRNTVSQVWTMMIDSLKSAANYLYDKPSWSGNDISRVTEWAVKAFLGKAYIYTEDWADAKTTLADVINNSGKSLVNFANYNNMFNGNASLKFNSESLFEVSMDVDKTTWGAWGPSTGSGIGMVISPCYMNDDASTGASGWSNTFVHDKNLRRFGFKQPVYTFVPNPAYNPAQPISLDNQDTICDPAYVATSKASRANKTVDPRLWVSCLEPYVDSMIASDKVTRTRPIVHYQQVENSYYAWSFRKYVNLGGSEYDDNVNDGADFYISRLADVYLLYAEACMHTNDNATALEYINKVHRRAYGYPPDAPSPVDYASLTSPTMAGDPVLANDPLKYERFAELFGEGSWWFDVCRWKIGSAEAAYYSRTKGGAILWDDNRSYAQPIPENEITTNPKIQQNPGYK